MYEIKKNNFRFLWENNKYITMIEFKNDLPLYSLTFYINGDVLLKLKQEELINNYNIVISKECLLFKDLLKLSKSKLNTFNINLKLNQSNYIKIKDTNRNLILSFYFKTNKNIIYLKLNQNDIYNFLVDGFNTLNKSLYPENIIQN